MVTQMSIEFGNFMRESKLELSDAFCEFAGENNLSLHDIAVLVAERPQLGRLKFISVAEVILQQAKGRPEQYTEFYTHLKWVVDAMKITGNVAKFSDIHRMATLRAKEAKVEKIPNYSASYQYIKRTMPDFFAKEEQEPSGGMDKWVGTFK